MYKAEEIAAYAIKTTEWMSNFKLQSVLYFVQAEFLVVKGRPCFDDPIEAWGFGPVIPTVYRQYAIYGGMMILRAKAPMPHLTKEDRELIDGIVNFQPKKQINVLKKVSKVILPDDYEMNAITSRSTFHGYSKH